MEKKIQKRMDGNSIDDERGIIYQCTKPVPVFAEVTFTKTFCRIMNPMPILQKKLRWNGIK